MEKLIKNIEDFNSFAINNDGAVFYFSTPDCNVCKVLKPKIISLLENKFPLMKFAYINLADAKELAAEYNVFTVPTILFYLDGKEYIRKSRNVNLYDLEHELDRLYNLYF